MAYKNNSTITVKGKHLTFNERTKIEVLKSEGYSNRRIAKILGRAPQTIHNEVKRGTTQQKRVIKTIKKEYTYYESKYFADTGQVRYDKQRLKCGRKPKWMISDQFIKWADEKILKHKWSPDVVVNTARIEGLFDRFLIPCTTTLYHWIDRQILKTRNIDLLEKVSRKNNTKNQRTKSNKRILGKSINERPVEVDSRTTFGHWEIDTVIGKKNKNEPVIVTLVERKTRFEVLLKANGKTVKDIEEAIEELYTTNPEVFKKLFQTITADNGSEFASLSEYLADEVDVYFAHPYASWERGTSENLHKIIRRFLPKGASLKDITKEELLRIQRWMNQFPRKILNYQTPHSLMLKEMKRLGLKNNVAI
ncbi:IS30 family transposase [Streptococcus suis]